MRINSMGGSENFCQGGGGGGAENSMDPIFVVVVFLVPNIFYNLQEGSNGFITEKTLFFQDFRGGPTFSRGGSSLFQGGGEFQMLISTGPHHIIEPVIFQGGLDPHVYTPVSAHEPVIFQGGGGLDTLSPLWIRTWTERQ